MDTQQMERIIERVKREVPFVMMNCGMRFGEEILGMQPTDKLIREEHIIANAPTQELRDEEKAVSDANAENDEEEEPIRNIKTIFPRDENGIPFMWNYQMKGMFKDNCQMLYRASGTLSGELSAYKKVIDGMIFVHPRKILLHMPEGGQFGECQRSLRVQGPKGERVALAVSETMPAGTTLRFQVKCLKMKIKKEKKDKNGKAEPGKKILDLTDCVREWLDYGSDRGSFQWRNSGKGIFTWDEYEAVASE